MSATQKYKIVFTGGPSAGKTTLLQMLKKEWSNTVAIVPESASILYQGGFHRSFNPATKIHIQKAIYFVQIESETIVQLENPNKHIFCDRGTLDGLAYWPDSIGKDFFKELNFKYLLLETIDFKVFHQETITCLFETH